MKKVMTSCPSKTRLKKGSSKFSWGPRPYYMTKTRKCIHIQRWRRSHHCSKGWRPRQCFARSRWAAPRPKCQQSCATQSGQRLTHQHWHHWTKFARSYRPTCKTRFASQHNDSRCLRRKQEGQWRSIRPLEGRAQQH